MGSGDALRNHVGVFLGELQSGGWGWGGLRAEGAILGALGVSELGVLWG